MHALNVVNACLALLAAAAFFGGASPALAQGSVAGPDCSSFPCGRIVSIRQTTVRQSWTPLGTGIASSPGDNTGQVVTSYQIGPGFSNQGMVLLGAGGGAAYKKSPSSYEQPRWEVTIRMDGGQTRVLTVAYEPYVGVGDHVRVAGNALELVD
jgi:hypothetical protein